MDWMSSECLVYIYMASYLVNRDCSKSNWDEHFKLKLNFIQMDQQMYQFDGFQDEDPYAHLTNFMELCDIFKTNEVSGDEIRLRLFPFSVWGRAQLVTEITRWAPLASSWWGHLHWQRSPNCRVISLPISKHCPKHFLIHGRDIRSFWGSILNMESLNGSKFRYSIMDWMWLQSKCWTKRLEDRYVTSNPCNTNFDQGNGNNWVPMDFWKE